MTVETPVLFTIDADGIGTLTLNRPAQLNAFDLPRVDVWRATLEQAEADERVKVVVVTGADLVLLINQNQPCDLISRQSEVVASP